MTDKVDPDHYLRRLSEEQEEAAMTMDNPVLIIAGAGSGKTATLVGRIVQLLKPTKEGGLGADPSSIMMVTFTNKAAREMRERILPVIEALRARNPNMRGGEPWIGTFHGLSLRILRVESHKAGLGKNFSIFDESDSRALANEVSEQLGLDTFDVDTFFRDIEFAKARLLTHELLAEKALDNEMALAMGTPFTAPMEKWARVLAHFETKGFTRMYSGYQRALEDQNAVDFSDLMNRVTKLFQDNADVRLSWMSSFRHFMVDEVQDINRAQVGWLSMITNGAVPVEIPKGAMGSEWANASDGMNEVNTYRLEQFPRPTVAFVGDDDQSIYGFRGSELRVMRDLETKFPGLEMRFLKQSYRCQPSILAMANVLVANNSQRYGKDVVAADPSRRASKIWIEEHTTPADEIRRIVAEANKHIAEGKHPDQYAVLTRTRDLAKAVAKELRAAGLPVTEGKALDIRKSAEVRDAMAFAGFLMNPDAETYLRRIINKPARGLGPTSVATVSANAKLKQITMIQEMRTIMDDRIDLPEEAKPYGKAFIRNLKDFRQLMKEVHAEIMGAKDAGAAILTILERTGYLPDLKEQALKSAGLKDEVDMTLPPREFLASLIKASADAKARKPGKESVDDLMDLDGDSLADRAGQLSDNARRIGNLSILIEQASVAPSLEAFMQEAMLEMEQKAGAPGIQVMTVHASKGLEFDRVRLPFMIDGIFPHGRAVEAGGEDIEEERRLLYVAATRAREDLLITRSWRLQNCPFIRLKQSYPSRFIKEMQAAGRDHVQLSSMKPSDARYNIGKLAEWRQDATEADAVAKKDAMARDIYGRGEAAVAAAAAPAAGKPAVTYSSAPFEERDAVAERFLAGLEDHPLPEDTEQRPFAPISEEDYMRGQGGMHEEDYGGMEPDYDPAPMNEERALEQDIRDMFADEFEPSF
ncbi:ATP-dependent helicase [Paracoccus litorisediminis]|uniref:ATP-dependent helicase n=1 Tax=Paracoccus litorisediminis TaxID=2006130 RepID=UPI0037313940